MNEDFFDRLRSIGFNQGLAQRLAGRHVVPDTLLRVTAVHRETVVVHDGVAERSARIHPRLLRWLAEEHAALAVGDWVVATEDGATWLIERIAPLNSLARRADDGVRQVVVSNVDTALLVMGLDGDFNPRRIERYLALASAAQVWPAIVLTKRDLAPEAESQIATLRARLPAGIALHAVNALAPTVRDELAPYLGIGQTVVLLGSSGAGKSTLTNTLLGAAVQDTGAVRAGDSRGRHTTTARSLHSLPSGACIIDTPGLRTLRLDIDDESLGASFTDVDRLAAGCRFRDCRHQGEPGCAVRAHVDADRLRNFHKLQREVRRDAMTALERRAQLAVWKARSRAAQQRMKMKRG